MQFKQYMLQESDGMKNFIAAAHRPQNVEDAIRVIFAGVKEGSIRNTEFKNAKDSITRAMEDYWKKEVNQPFFNGGRYEQFRGNASMEELQSALLYPRFIH